MLRSYWDSCVLIYRVQGVEPWNEQIAGRLLARPHRRLIVTELTRFECRIRPLQEADAQTLAAFDRFFASPTVEFGELTRPTFDLAAELRAHHRLKAIDALHLASAISSECDEFWTNDLRLERASAGRIKVISVDASS
jgi:uncharacterized protein